MNEFKVGDVVNLKSGSPPMTVTLTMGHTGEGDSHSMGVVCNWFVGEQRYEDTFSSSELQLTNLKEDQKLALYAVLNLLVIDCNQMKLKLAAAERLLEKDQQLRNQYHSELRRLRDNPDKTPVEQALELLLGKLSQAA